MELTSNGREVDITFCSLRRSTGHVLVQPEVEKRRSPLLKIPPLRGGDFQGMRVYRPMTSSRQRAAREKKLPRC
jgi:hypothetical protein